MQNLMGKKRTGKPPIVASEKCHQPQNESQDSSWSRDHETEGDQTQKQQKTYDKLGTLLSHLPYSIIMSLFFSFFSI